MTIHKKQKEKPFINPLLQGCESEYRFNLILGLTSIRSELIITALRQHYVTGIADEMIFIDAGNYKRGKNTLGRVAAQIEKIKDYDWVKHGKH